MIGKGHEDWGMTTTHPGVNIFFERYHVVGVDWGASQCFFASTSYEMTVGLRALTRLR